MPTTMERIDDILTPEKLAAFTEEELDELEFFSMFLEKLIIIEGKKGSGKTLLSICLLKKLNKYFDVHTVTDQKLRSAFGEYTYLDEKLFVKEIDKVSDIARSTTQDDVDIAVEWSLKKHGVVLEGSAILLDEAYKYFDCRTPSDKLVRIFGYFVAQMRHYCATLILCAPNRRYLDKRVRDQIDFLAKVAYNSRTEFVHTRFLDYSTGEVTGLRVFGPNFRHMYDSWSPIALRKKVLNIKGNM